MSFRTVEVTTRRRTGAGEYDSTTTALLCEADGAYTDPETGKMVTTYPPGYAWGYEPQKNIRVKGGS